MKYEAIKAQSADFPVERLCKVLEVKRSSYYAWHRRGQSQRAQQDESR